MIPLLLALTLTQTPEEKEAVRDAVAEAGMNDAAIAKMSGDQIHDVLRHGHRGDNETVALLAVGGSYVVAIVCVLGVLFAVYRIYRQRAETLRLMVEKGVPIPPELLAPKPRPHADLRRGLVLSTFGVGLGIFLFAVSDVRGMWTLGLVPLLVGVGYLVVFRVTKNEATSATVATT